MKAVDNVGITFVNTVLGRVILNNVVNIQLGAFQFSPDAKGEAVEVDLVTACRLRMDKACARQLYDNLGELFALVEKAETSNGVASETAGVEEQVPTEQTESKLN